MIAPSVISAEHRRRLRLFNEMADKLLGSRFVDHMFTHGSGFKISGDNTTGTVSAEFNGPDAESVDALVLTIRMFIRDRDGISFREMGDVYDDPAVPAELRARFHTWRDGIRGWLASTPADGGISLNFNGRDLTRDDVLDVVVYGGLAHANERKRALYEEWRAMPPFYVMVWDTFTVTLVGVSQCVRDIRDTNLELLQQVS